MRARKMLVNVILYSQFLVTIFWTIIGCFRWCFLFTLRMVNNTGNKMFNYVHISPLIYNHSLFITTTKVQMHYSLLKCRGLGVSLFFEGLNQTVK
jgi:hypothetical protein